MDTNNDLKKHKYLVSFGRTKGKNLHADRLKSLSHYVKKDYYNLSGNYHLEIGFGYGEHLLYKAEANPDINYIGCEVYLNGIAHLLTKIESQNIKNISLWPYDGRELLEKLPDHIIEKVYILFPDPWPKRRTNKRRLINKDFLLYLTNKMSEKGNIIIATDHDGYSSWIAESLAQVQLSYTQDRPKYMNNITTRYQAKAADSIKWFDIVL